MNTDFKDGKKAGLFFAKSVKRTGQFVSDDDAKDIASNYSEEYQRGFMLAWNTFWREPLMKQF